MASEAGHGRSRLLHVFATFDAGGPQVRTIEVMRRLGAAHDHVVVAADGRTGAASRLPPGTPVHAMRRPASTLRQLRELQAIVRHTDPHLVLTYNWGAILGGIVARASGIPFVHHEEVVPIEERASGLVRRDWIRRVVLRGCSKLVVPSGGLHERAVRRWGVAPSRIERIANGVELDGRVPARACAAAHRPFVVGTVAHLRPEKNLPRLIRAVARLARRDVQLLVAGEGPERAACERLVDRLGLGARVQLLGAVDDPRACYAVMDVFVLPSDNEQMPLAVLEAMAHGLPVVATDVGEVAAMLPGDQQRFVVAAGPGAEHAMALALESLLADAELRARLGAANRALAESRHDLGTAAARYESLYLGHARARLRAEACA